MISWHIVDGYEDGEYKSWYQNGQFSVVGQYKMGKPIGKWIYYHNDGSISEVSMYKEDGTFIDVTKDYINK